MGQSETKNETHLLRVRTITGFLELHHSDFLDKKDDGNGSGLDTKMTECAELLRNVQQELHHSNYVVQTLRIATNPFGEWLVDETRDQQVVKSRLNRLDTVLSINQIEFCSLGPARNREERIVCPIIVSASGKFSCSAIVPAGDSNVAMEVAETILFISKLGNEETAPPFVKGGLGNFRFCAACSCQPFIPFFPAAKSESTDSENANRNDRLKFAVGFENGIAARQLLQECSSISKIRPDFGNAFAAMLEPVQAICEVVANQRNATFLGIDSSLNPSLDKDGSVAEAMEQLTELQGCFGRSGTLSAAAEITKALQNLPNIKLCGYCGLMLPVCEDTRLAELAQASSDNDETRRALRISDLLSISSVCGVGVDTVPIPGDCLKQDLAALILDVAGIAGRWNKSLSCRVFPVPGRQAGDFTDFGSPYMVNTKIFSIR